MSRVIPGNDAPRKILYLVCSHSRHFDCRLIVQIRKNEHVCPTYLRDQGTYCFLLGKPPPRSAQREVGGHFAPAEYLRNDAVTTRSTPELRIAARPHWSPNLNGSIVPLQRDHCLQENLCQSPDALPTTWFHSDGRNRQTEL